MNDYEQYFTILNLSNNASLQDIKKAYRQLSIKYHPDKNSQADPVLFNKVNDAYVKLTNNFNIIQSCIQNTTSLMYPQEQHIKQSTIKQSTIIQNTPQHYNNSPDSLHNINNYEDITITLNITYYDAYTGASKPITIERKLFTNNVISNETETLYVAINKGVDNNEMILLQNKGNRYTYNSTTSYSNIKIIIILIKHEYFERNGLDLIYLKTISLKEALIGCNFTFIHINNKHYKIVSNEIIDFNYVKIVNNLGFIRETYIGNLIIKFTIIFPKVISQDNKIALQTIL